MYAISRSLGIREGFVSDEEVEVFYTTLGCEVSGFGRDCGSS
jgi:hypothetical protein